MVRVVLFVEGEDVGESESCTDGKLDDDVLGVHGLTGSAQVDGVIAQVEGEGALGELVVLQDDVMWRSSWGSVGETG